MNPQPPPSQFVDASNERSPAVIALRSTLSGLLDAICRPVTSPDEIEAHHPPRRLFVADAFSNPAHWQFALKTTMAVMISYAIYTLLDWPGMRTAVVTCFFVALSSLGETVHKLLLRLSGAVIGGLIAGLCIVFVLPHLTDIGQLCLLIAAVSVGAAWVATSSELLSYAGMQIAFAFFLGILQGYAPATDLTVLRDRVAGILLGNIVITIVFSSFWPQSARSGVRAAIAEALRAIGEVIRQPRNAEEARMRTVQALVRADHLRTLSLFELRMLPSHVRDEPNRSLCREYRTARGGGLRRFDGCDFPLCRTGIYCPLGRMGRVCRRQRLERSAGASESRANRFLADNRDGTRRTLKPTRHRTTRVGGSACCFGGALNARRTDWPLLPACSALIWRSRKRRRVPSKPGRFQNRPSAAPPPWAMPVFRFRISSTIWRRWLIWQKEKIQKRGRLGKSRVKRPRVSASQKARIFRSFPCRRSEAFSTRRCQCPRNLVPAGYFVSDTREVIPALALKWLLFDFGRRDAQLQAARADSFVANVAFTGAHQKLIFEVSQAYFDLGAARGKLHAAQKALSTALTTQDAAVAKQNNGLATVVAVAQAQRQTAQARYTLAAAEGAERTARANLIAALGVPAATEIDVVDSAELPLPPAPADSVSKAVDQALAHRPDVIAALGKVDAAEAALKGERRSYYPVIELSGQAFQNIGSLNSDGGPYSNIDRPGQSILLSFSVPLFDGGTRRNRISMADAKAREAQEQLAAARDSASQQVVRAYNGLLTSLAEYDAATVLSQAAHTAYEAALRSYRQGVGTYTDLATEENAVVQGDTQVEDARANAHTAAAALALSMGAIDIAGVEP